MAVLATDNFNRADGGLGSSWTSNVPGFSAIVIASNAAVPTALGSDCCSFYNAVSWPNDQYAQVKVTVTGGAGADLGIGPQVRCASGATTFYRLNWNGAATSNISLTKAVAGAFTTLWTRTATIAAGDTLRLEVQGTTLRAYVNGVQVGADTTDNSIASGNAGVNYSSATSTASADDFEGGDFTSAASAPGGPQQPQGGLPPHLILQLAARNQAQWQNTAGTADVAAADTPAGLRAAESPATVAFDMLVADTPAAVRLSESPATAGPATAVSDTPAAVRAAESPATVTTTVLIPDAPSAVRAGPSPAATTIDVLTGDAPAGIRAAESPATAGSTTFVPDTPSGVRAGTSPATVTIHLLVADTPNGARPAESPATTAVGVTIADAPSGLRAAESPAAAGSTTFVVDLPTGLRAGTSPAAVLYHVAVPDTPAGLRAGASPGQVLLPVSVADLVSGLRLATTLATVTVAAFQPILVGVDGSTGITGALDGNATGTGLDTSSTSAGQLDGGATATGLDGNTAPAGTLDG